MAKKKVDPFAGIELGFVDKSKTMPPRQKVDLGIVSDAGENKDGYRLQHRTHLIFDPEKQGRCLLRCEYDWWKKSANT